MSEIKKNIIVPISERLRQTAELVTQGNCVADIGCDHAYTSIYLLQKSIAKKVIALDINIGPIQIAKDNIERYGLRGCIDVRLADGAQGLFPGEADSLLISGMGGGLIIRILKESFELVKNIKEWILQPQSDIAAVRYFLHGKGYRIDKEIMIIEGNKYYVIIKAVPGKERYEKRIFYQYGKNLLIERNAVLYDFLLSEQRVQERIRSKLDSQDSPTIKIKERLEQITNILAENKEATEYFGER